jgi:ATP-dependent DNA helicase RecQ
MKCSIQLAMQKKKSNHNETEVQAVLQKLKGKEIINYQSKNNDSTLILMKFAKMKEQLVGFI